MKLIDSHCHVHFNAYKDDMDEVIKRTLDKGVFMITVGTQKDTSQNGIDVAERYEGVWAAAGLHPNHTVEQEFYDRDELPVDEQVTPKIKTRCETLDKEFYREMLKHPKCIAVGEIGLDFYRIPETADRDEIMRVQLDTIRAQFDLATEENLPVIIHTRESHKEMLDVLREYVDAGKLPRRGVMHGFVGTLEEACAYLDLGFYLGFNGILTFSKELQEVLKELPLDRLLVETDSPYISPVPERGKRNEPWRVKYIAEKIAELKKTTYNRVAEQTTENAKSLFGI